MLCSGCRTHLLSRLPFPRLSSSIQPSRCANSLLSRNYSTPAPPTPEVSDTTTPPAKKPSSSPVLSSVPAGTKLEGLNYFKNKPELFALEDSEYPKWLWGLLDGSSAKKGKGGEVDVSTMNRKARKRHEKKMAALAASRPPVIPIHEHATDITPASAIKSTTATDANTAKNIKLATEGVKARQEIRKSSRLARKKVIKENNFLAGL